MANQSREKKDDRSLEEKKEAIESSRSRLQQAMGNFEAHLNRRNRILENLAQSSKSAQARALVDEEIEQTQILRERAMRNYAEVGDRIDREIEKLSQENDSDKKKENNSSSR